MQILSGRRSPEYSRSVKLGSGLAILNLALSSCVYEARGATIDPTQSPTAPRVTETFSPTATPDVILGPSVEQDRIVAFGRAVGAGGQNPIETTFGGSNLMDVLWGSGLWPIIDGSRTNSRGENLITQTAILPDGSRMCFPNSPVVLFNPDVASGQDDLIRSSNFIRYYGDGSTQDVRFQTIEAISLEKLPGNVVCVNAIARPDVGNIFDARSGTVMTVLMDRDTAKIIGAFRSVFAATDTVSLDQATGRLTVNGQSVWFEGPGVLQLTPTPTETPSYEQLQSLKPAGVEGEVIIGENGNPQLSLEVINSNFPDNRVSIAEYKGGQWNIIPFSFTRNLSDMVDIGRSGNYFFRYSEVQDLGKQGLLLEQWTGTTATMGLKVERASDNSLTATLLQADRNGIFKTEIDDVWFANRTFTSHYVVSIDEMTLQDMARLVSRMSLDFQMTLEGGPVKVFFFPTFAAVEMTAEIDSCDNFHLSKVAERCRRGVQNGTIARYNNAQEMVNAVRKSTVRPGQYSQPPDWWDDNVIPEVPSDIIFFIVVKDANP